MSSTHRLRQNQQGIISIMMTVVMIIVISLIVLGLAQISRREQRQSTDNQLSTQALYAAESGINDVVDYLRSNGGSVTEKHDCSNGAPYNTVLEPNIATGVSYSCVLVDAGPPTVTAPVNPESTVYNLSSTPALDQLTFTWTPATGIAGASLSKCPDASEIKKKDLLSIKPANSGGDNWTCPYAMLRVDLVDASSVTRDDLINNTQTVFLVPVKGGTKTLGTAPGLRLQSADCNGLVSCSYTFTVPSGSSYYARVNGIYRSGNLTINGTNSSGTAVTFNAIATIDVTGKAQDVLRRIRATVNLQGSNQNGDANAGLVSGNSICKYYSIDRTTGIANSGSICP